MTRLNTYDSLAANAAIPVCGGVHNVMISFREACPALKEKVAIGGGTAAKLTPPTAHYASRAPRSSESIVTTKTYPKLSV